MALTPTAIASMNAQETDEVWLPMVVLTHPDWDGAVRMVRNNEDVVHLGETFQAADFSISLPDEEEGVLPIVRWQFNNINLELIELVRSVVGPIKGFVFYVLASEPDDYVIEPITLELRAIPYNDRILSGQMVVEPVIHQMLGSRRMDNVNAPGLH